MCLRPWRRHPAAPSTRAARSPSIDAASKHRSLPSAVAAIWPPVTGKTASPGHRFLNRFNAKSALAHGRCEPMRIEFRSSAARPRLWVLDLAARLEARGHLVAFDIAKQAASHPGETSLNLLFELEGLLYGVAQPQAGALA